MRKISGLLCLFVLLSAFTCENEPLEGDFTTETNVSCEDALLNTIDAALAFANVSEDNYTELCNDYKEALQAQIDACGDPDGSIQSGIDALGNCNPGTGDDCENATIAVNLALVNFNNATPANYTDLCNSYRLALQNQINLCGDDDGTLLLEMDSLGDCTNDVGQDEEIPGTWKLTAWIGEEPIDLNNDGTESINFLDEMDCYENETIVFSADGTAVAMSTSYASFNFDIEVGTTDEYDYTIDCIMENENTDLTWTQNGNIISVTDAGVTTDGTLDGNQLSIFIPDGFVAFNADFTATTTQDLTFVYTKQ
ncbi:hypothetical protein A9Q87_11295 [Flavobacteriales bacterium 34_180_T64]|nr:hypothetical protein A9Q87_11295 [Flavobacteriales bacterium 34_180_T64]